MYYHLYKDTASEWRWRLVASNGRIVANSGEGYKNRDDYGLVRDPVTNLVHDGEKWSN